MTTRRYDVGELVFARVDIHNDGGVPDVEELGLLAAAGTKGVVVRTGSAQSRQELRIYLVRFEGADEILGPPVGCLDEELTQDERACEMTQNESASGLRPPREEDPPLKGN
jgi:nitrogen fixation protein NifZ